MKDWGSCGGLVRASPSVVAVCKETERCYQRILSVTEGDLPREVGIDQAIAIAVLQRMDLSRIFSALDSHMLQGSVTDNHVFHLIKTVSLSYSKIRLHHLAKQSNSNIPSRGLEKPLQS